MNADVKSRSESGADIVIGLIRLSITTIAGWLIVFGIEVVSHVDVDQCTGFVRQTPVGVRRHGPSC